MALMVGQKVVCINDKWHRHDWGNTSHIPDEEPEKGMVYTIASLCESPLETQALTLVEFHPQHSFSRDAFKPVVERGTDTGMAILRKLLTDNRVDA